MTRHNLPGAEPLDMDLPRKHSSPCIWTTAGTHKTSPNVFTCLCGLLKRYCRSVPCPSIQGFPSLFRLHFGPLLSYSLILPFTRKSWKTWLLFLAKQVINVILSFWKLEVIYPVLAQHRALLVSGWEQWMFQLRVLLIALTVYVQDVFLSKTISDASRRK